MRLYGALPRATPSGCRRGADVDALAGNTPGSELQSAGALSRCTGELCSVACAALADAA